MSSAVDLAIEMGGIDVDGGEVGDIFFLGAGDKDSSVDFNVCNVAAIASLWLSFTRSDGIISSTWNKKEWVDGSRGLVIKITHLHSEKIGFKELLSFF